MLLVIINYYQLIIPDFRNSSLESDEIGSIDNDWGRDFYASHFAFLERSKNDK